MKRGKITISHYNDNIVVSTNNKKQEIWHTTNEIADMFMIHQGAIISNIKRIFSNEELIENKVTRCFNGITYYNIDLIIALAFSCKGVVCRKFREWLRCQAFRPATDTQPIIIHINNNTFLS